MSKSLKNVINPDDIIKEFGADTFRIYEMYMGPARGEQALEHRRHGRAVPLPPASLADVRSTRINGRGLARNGSTDPAIEKLLHRTIAKVGDDIDRVSLNTAIAAMIEFVNLALKPGLTRDQMDRFVRVLAPFAPHIAEEIWHKLGHETSVAHADWPGYEESMLVDDEVEIAIQVLGKVKAKLSVPTGASEDELKELALKNETIAGLIEGKTVRKIVVVPGRLVNIVAN